MTKDRKEVLQLSESIVRDGWQVQKFMIDKCRAEMNAIKRGE